MHKRNSPRKQEVEEPEDRLGMTEEQWAQFQAYTHGYGEQDENGVDLSLLRENLKLTPTERLERMDSAHMKIGPRTTFLAKAHLEHIRLLNSQRASFVIVGDVAIRLHGGSDLSSDLDILYERTQLNLVAIERALSSAEPRFRDGAGISLPWSADVLRLGRNFMLRTETGDLDLLADLPGAESYERLVDRGRIIDLAGQQVRVASVDDLISMKRAANRPKDQLHVMELEALRKMIQEQCNKPDHPSA